MSEKRVTRADMKEARKRRNQSKLLPGYKPRTLDEIRRDYKPRKKSVRDKK